MAPRLWFRDTDELIRDGMDSAEGDEFPLDRSPWENLAKSLAVFAIGIVAVILFWWAVAAYYNTFHAASQLFPTPPETFSMLWEFLSGRNLFGTDIYQHTMSSLSRWGKGFLVAFPLGAVAGIAMGYSGTTFRFGMVPMTVLQMIPGLAWLPVTIILFGFGNMSAIFMVGIVVISPMAINTASGIRKIPEINKRVASMSELSRTDTLLEVSLPFASLDIINGLRMAIGNSWRMIIAAEMVVGVTVGLGYSILNTAENMDYVVSFVCIIIICVIGIFIDKVLLERFEAYMRRKVGYAEES